MNHYTYYQSAFGRLLLICSNHRLEQIIFPNQLKETSLQRDWKESEKPFSSIFQQLDQYFNGKRKNFDIPVNPIGTVFQKKVWLELMKIPFGKTIHYGELATRIGNPKASRAVGAANGRNPIPIIIPCHRVIGKNGSLTGFAGGIEVKKFLLDLEQYD